MLDQNKGLGIQVGIVVNNVDLEKMHRVLVEFPVDSHDGKTNSWWCRILTPMAGPDRGLVFIPMLGTEVVVAFSARSMNPYILGCVYNNKDDTPDNYKNDDQKNNLRLLWSRNDHLIMFDDTDGAEKVALGAQASSAEDETSAPIYQTLSSSEKKITEYCDGDTKWEATNTISIKCADFELMANNSVTSESMGNTAIKAGANQNIEAGAIQTWKGAQVRLNEGDSATPRPTLALPPHSHPPSKTLVEAVKEKVSG